MDTQTRRVLATKTAGLLGVKHRPEYYLLHTPRATMSIVEDVFWDSGDEVMVESAAERLRLGIWAAIIFAIGVGNDYAHTAVLAESLARLLRSARPGHDRTVYLQVAKSLGVERPEGFTRGIEASYFVERFMRAASRRIAPRNRTLGCALAFASAYCHATEHDCADAEIAESLDRVAKLLRAHSMS